MSTAVTVTARPANIARTTWTLRVNRELVELEIETQGGPGGPGGSECLAIDGKLNGIAPIHGWYNPSSGRIHFLHNNVNTSVTVRVFTGSVSDDAPGEDLYMAGTMTVVNVGFGVFGEFNFRGTTTER
jgi:hypothetical protein